MTLIEAIKSGEKFKRAIWTDDDWITNESIIIPLRRADIVADDWVVKWNFAVEREELDQEWAKLDLDAIFVNSEKAAEMKRWIAHLVGSEMKRWIAHMVGL